MPRMSYRRPAPAGTPCPASNRKPSNPPAPGWPRSPAASASTCSARPGPGERPTWANGSPSRCLIITEWAGGRPGATAVDPADRVTLDESVSMAFLVVLESMTPAERVAFILHDVFRFSFTDVAEITGRTPAAC